MVVFRNFSTQQQSEIMTTALDLAKTAAGYASNQGDIASSLYEIERISNQSSSVALLSPKDELTLLDVYLQIEHYLMTADPIRTFNKEELRNKASRGLRARLEAYERQASTVTQNS
ncbi:MAG TPA: hypothetical protein VFZ48_02115 [Candidatus Saccharimonadales bacterium]